MRFKSLGGLASAALLVIGTVAVFAQETFTPPATAEAAIAMREDVMKQNGGILRSAGDLTGAEAVAAMQTIATNYSHIPALFPEGSVGGEALPAIWENWDAFVAIAAKGQKAAEDAVVAAQAGDAAAYAEALKAVGATCGECHQQFRS